MKIVDYLTSLGSTSEEIARTLHSMGIRGERYSACNCPILNAVDRDFPNIWGKKCGLKAIYFVNSAGYATSAELTYDDPQVMDTHLPQLIAAFMHDFDMGKYPELVGETQDVVVCDNGGGI